MKMTFKCKIVADISDDPETKSRPASLGEPTYRWLGEILRKGRFTAEMAMPWSRDSEPTILIIEAEPAAGEQQ
jgi:hypothetical protein